jgi:hypothetical protein
MYQESSPAMRERRPTCFGEYAETDGRIPTIPRARYIDRAVLRRGDCADVAPRSGSLHAAKSRSLKWATACCYGKSGASILLVRSAPDEIKAFYNTCGIVDEGSAVEHEL